MEVSMKERQRQWFIFVENRQAVIEALTRGECDGLLPAARSFLDGFAGFLLNHGIMAVFEAFPEQRARQSIPVVFFCGSLLYRPLFQLPSLQAVGDVLFRSPYILRQMGFNAVQIGQGFYRTNGRKPFDEEAVAEFFAPADADTFLAHQEQVLHQLYQEFPWLFRQGVWAMDSVSFSTPKGNHGLPEGRYKVCILGVCYQDTVLPLLWLFAPEEAHDLPLGQRLVERVEAALGQGVIKNLLVDRALLDGAWLTLLWHHGTHVTVSLRENMDVLSDMLGLARLGETEWMEVPPPDNHRDPAPQREITGFTDLTSWEACQAPLCGCLIRDHYPDHTEYQGVVMTAEAGDAKTIYERHTQRWDHEELLMSLTRYWHFDRLPPCRVGVAYALVHFALLAFTLLNLYQGEGDHTAIRNQGPPPLPLPEREIAVYAGPYFTLLRPSELMEIIFTYWDVWADHRDAILDALKRFEGSP